MATFDIKGLARRGAQLRVAELNAELAQLYRAFPELRSGAPGRMSRQTSAASAGPATRSRRRMTAAQRKEVSLRMKRYWAQRRKAKE